MNPEQAWLPYSPSESRPWNRVRAAHLYRRAGFGATAAQIDDAVSKSPAEVVDQIFQPPGATQFRQQMTAFGKTILANRNPRRLPAWWLYQMIHSPDQLLEKTTLFWHGHFATSAAKVDDAKAMLAQNQLLRKHALGDFEALVLGVSADPAMLVYLDSTDNRRTHPNENYARELLELFCLGVNNYKEKDIQEIARCFTGWQVRRGKFRFNTNQHDQGEKEIFGQRGNFGGEDAVRLVLKQDSAARFIARKLFVFYVRDELLDHEETIERLAHLLRSNGMEIGRTIRQILSSNIFFAADSIGKKIRSPVECALGALRLFGASANLYELADELEQLGQLPFYPPNVKGWDGGRNWINASNMLGRANLMRSMMLSEKTSWSNGTLDDWLRERELTTPAMVVGGLIEHLVAVPVPGEVRRRLTEFAQGLNLQDHTDVGKLVHLMSLTPEFQLN